MLCSDWAVKGGMQHSDLVGWDQRSMKWQHALTRLKRVGMIGLKSVGCTSSPGCKGQEQVLCFLPGKIQEQIILDYMLDQMRNERVI